MIVDAMTRCSISWPGCPSDLMSSRAGRLAIISTGMIQPKMKRDSRDVDEKKALENLRDHLVGADKQHHLPFRPIADAIDLPENDAKENNLSAEPKDLDDHPEQEVCLESHLANERVAQHDGVDFDVTAH